MYTPDAYEKEPNRCFPVLYWLHGGGGGVRHLPMASRMFDDAITSGKIPPMLVVFPNGMAMSNWVDSKDGKLPMEAVVIRELIPDVDSHYRTIADRQGRIVEGFSMGGYGAARFIMKYPDLFVAASIFSGGPLQKELTPEDGPPQSARARVQVLRVVYGNDQEYFRQLSPWLLAEKNADSLRRNKVRLRIVVGDEDRLFSMNEAFSRHLRALGIEHEFRVLPGVGHQPPRVFQALGDDNWAFYQKVWSSLDEGVCH